MNVLRSEHKTPDAVLLLTLLTEQPVTPQQVAEFGRMVAEAESWYRLNEPSDG